VRNLAIRTAVLTLSMLAIVAWTVAAQSRLPQLPQPYTLAQSGDSPGKVTFNHTSHVSESKPSCTGCHPTVFKILRAGTAADGKAITHDAMKQGKACGACHDGKKTFGIDDCTMCHK